MFSFFVFWNYLHYFLKGSFKVKEKDYENHKDSVSFLFLLRNNIYILSISITGGFQCLDCGRRRPSCLPPLSSSALVHISIFTYGETYSIFSSTVLLCTVLQSWFHVYYHGHGLAVACPVSQLLTGFVLGWLGFIIKFIRCFILSPMRGSWVLPSLRS